MTNTATTSGLVKPVTCSRCHGKGWVDAGGINNNVCAKCGGAKVVEGDRATLARARAVNGFTAWAITEGHRRDPGARCGWAAASVRHLQKHEPERYEKALASWQAGRPDLYDALLALAVDAAAGATR